MSIRSIWGPRGKVGSIAHNGGDKEIAYDRDGRKLGEADRYGVRDTTGRPIIRQRLIGILFNRNPEKPKKR
jgi:hypothetical protein